jgi:hypothetical protein
MSRKNTAVKHTVLTTKNGAVKHARYISVLQAQAQNAKNADLYSVEQKQQARELAQAVQAQYFTKRVYTNLRDTFIAIKIANAQICTNLLTIAKRYNAQVVTTKNDGVVLRLFANN